jgi:hypothetical protein
MPGFVHVLRCVGRAALKNGGKALASLVPFGEVAFEIARDACEEYRKGRGAAGLRQGLEALAPTSPVEGRSPAEGAQAALPLVSYLDQAPAIRPPEGARVHAHGGERAYALLRRLGVGDVADVYLAQAETGPGSEEGPGYVLKVSRGPEGHAFLENEREALARLVTGAGDTTYRRYLPASAGALRVKDEPQMFVNVFPHEPGLYTLEEVHGRHPALDGRHLAWVFKRLLTVLGFAHRQGWVHGAVLPCHVLVHPADHGLRLVGWGQSVEVGRPIRAIPTRYRGWYPPEALKKQAASEATDLFLAARCMTYLAGGGPVRDRAPGAVPAPMRRFFDACLLEGRAMRPHDAWELLDDLDDLLRRLYGPPKFHDLTMT